MLRKIPFSRRKSSGNVLEDTENHEGFRVLTQNEVHERKIASEARKSGRLSGVKPFSSPVQKARQRSFEEDSSGSNRGSNSSGTANSAMSKIYDNSSSSARFSSSSTLPSSAEQETNEDPSNKAHESRTFSIRGAARTFTFSNRSRKGTLTAPPKSINNEGEGFEPTVPVANVVRDRSMTTSSYASTATPPKVDTDLYVGTSDFSSGFDGLFDGFDKTKGASSERKKVGGASMPGNFRSESDPNLTFPPNTLSKSRTYPSPSPISTDRLTSVDASPHSMHSPKSADELIAGSPDSTRNSKAEPPPVPVHRNLEKHSSQSRSQTYVSLHDPDAQIVANSVSSDRSYTPTQGFQPQGYLLRQESGAALFDSDTASLPSDSTLRPKISTPSLGGRFLDNGVLNGNSSRSDLPQPATKVMNQAQFNSYRRQMEINELDSDSDGSSIDNYEDDEDELERQREMEKQRRKQEGNLAVYRQQMQKATGEKTKSTEALGLERPPSQPRLTLSEDIVPSISPPLTLSSTNVKQPTNNADSESDSPDDDVPLGFLMAHGFPNKNRPPSKIAPSRTSSGGVVLSSPSPSTQTPVTESPSASRTSILPPFARNLPQDPYFGAGLINQPNRESLTFGQNNPGSVYGGSNSGGVPQSARHTTLVNVIANEERAKAQRRGSPKAQNGFGPSLSQPQQATAISNMGSLNASQMNLSQMNLGQMNMDTTGNSQMNMGAMGHPQMDMMAHLLANQQMLQQQMVQGQLMLAQMLQGQPPQAQLPQMPMPNTLPNSFPNQMLSPDFRPPTIAGPQQMQPRPQSSPAGVLQPVTNQRYSASIAPSERSTVGRASRYRPVTVHAVDGSDSVSSIPLQHHFSSAPQLKSHDAVKAPKKGIFGVLKKRPDSNVSRVDEEDEEGWGDIRSRKTRWGDHKNSSTEIQELYPGNL